MNVINADIALEKVQQLLYNNAEIEVLSFGILLWNHHKST
jgi:hypothetical protein